MNVLYVSCIVLIYLWYFYLLFGITTLSFTIIIGSIRYLDGGTLDRYSQIFMLPSIYFPVLAILSYILYIKMKNFTDVKNIMNSIKSPYLARAALEDKYVPQYLVLVCYICSIDWQVLFIRDWAMRSRYL